MVIPANSPAAFIPKTMTADAAKRSSRVLSRAGARGLRGPGVRPPAPGRQYEMQTVVRHPGPETPFYGMLSA
jgi:hypothetical protein